MKAVGNQDNFNNLVPAGHGNSGLSRTIRKLIWDTWFSFSSPSIWQLPIIVTLEDTLTDMSITLVLMIFAKKTLCHQH